MAFDVDADAYACNEDVATSGVAIDRVVAAVAVLFALLCVVLKIRYWSVEEPSKVEHE